MEGTLSRSVNRLLAFAIILAFGLVVSGFIVVIDKLPEWRYGEFIQDIELLRAGK